MNSNLKQKTQKPLNNLDYFGVVLASFPKDIVDALGGPDEKDKDGSRWFRETSLGDPFILMDMIDGPMEDDFPKDLKKKGIALFYVVAENEDLSVQAMKEISEACACDDKNL